MLISVAASEVSLLNFAENIAVIAAIGEEKAIVSDTSIAQSDRNRQSDEPMPPRRNRSTTASAE